MVLCTFAVAAVSYLDRDTFYTRPEDALARYDARLRQLVRDGIGAVRAFAELPRCAGSADIDRWIRYEAVVNRALAHHPLWVVCGYDAREMPAAPATHPSPKIGMRRMFGCSFI